MTKEDFLENIREEFIESSASLSLSSNYKELPDWDSMLALSIISNIDENYNVVISDEDITKAQTIEDLFIIVAKKK